MALRIRNHQLLFTLDLLPSLDVSSFGTGTDQTSISHPFFPPCCICDSAGFYHIPLSFHAEESQSTWLFLVNHFQTFSSSVIPILRHWEPELHTRFWENIHKHSSCSYSLPWRADQSGRSEESEDAEGAREVTTWKSHMNIGQLGHDSRSFLVSPCQVTSSSYFLNIQSNLQVDH